ncbi:MAG TPA: protein translocase SEC61 complex subunit gamma [Candidatus Baltobacteraceae bacterium]|nr:protein translocase SEC61 complex subunit gamma [Candidatus Baltobacteraceae bacterium]
MQIFQKIKSFIDNSRHVMSISYKPTRTEFNKSAKVIILGIILIGVIGFLLSIVISFITTGVLP